MFRFCGLQVYAESSDVGASVWLYFFLSSSLDCIFCCAMLCIHLRQFRVFTGKFPAVWVCSVYPAARIFTTEWCVLGISCCKDTYRCVMCVQYILLRGYFTDVFCECIVHPSNRMFTGLGCLQYSISAASIYIVTALQRVKYILLLGYLLLCNMCKIFYF